MRETRIIDLGDRQRYGHSDYSVLQKIEEFFVSENYITKDQIRSIAHQAAEEVRKKIEGNGIDQATEVRVLFQALDLWLTFHPRSFNSTGKIAHGEITPDTVAIYYTQSCPPDGVEPDTDTNEGEFVVQVSRREVEEALSRIREALLQELKPLVDPIPLHIVETVLHRYRVFQERGGDIVKKTKDSLTFPWVYAVPITRALLKLYADPEKDRSPYIAYTLQERDSESGVEFHKELAGLTNLGDLIRGSKITPEQLNVYLKYFLDNLKGGKFLVDKGLGLGDINLYNLGVDTQKASGKLFDFDYLVRNDIKVKNEFYGHLGENFDGSSVDYKPPRRLDKDGRHPISEQEMIYQFAVSLEHLLNIVGFQRPTQALRVWPEENKDTLREWFVFAEKIKEKATENLYDKTQSFHLQEVIVEFEKLLAVRPGLAA